MVGVLPLALVGVYMGTLLTLSQLARVKVAGAPIHKAPSIFLQTSKNIASAAGRRGLQRPEAPNPPKCHPP